MRGAERKNAAVNERQFAFVQPANAQRRTRLDAEIGNERIERLDGARTSIGLELPMARNWNGRNRMICKVHRKRHEAQFLDILILEERPIRIAEIAVTTLG